MKQPNAEELKNKILYFLNGKKTGIFSKHWRELPTVSMWRPPAVAMDTEFRSRLQQDSAFSFRTRMSKFC